MVFVALSLILVTNTVLPAAHAIIYFPEISYYIDPLTKKFTVVGEVRNYHPTWKPIANLTIGIEFLSESQEILAKRDVRVPNLLPTKEINVPYFASIPFKVVLDDVALSQQIKYGSSGTMMLNEGKYKPADLLLLYKRIYQIESNEYGKRWAVVGEIRNNYTQPAENVYVVASLYDAEGFIIGVAGFDSTDKQPVTIGPMQNKEFLITTWLPRDRIPLEAKIHAESESSILRSAYYFPLIPKHKFADASGSWLSDPTVGKEIRFMSNVTNIAREDKQFVWIVQVKKLPEEDPLVFPSVISYSATEDIGIIHSSAKPLETVAVEYTWVPEEKGQYFYEIYIWNSLENPVPLSYAHIDRFYSPTIFFVLQ